MFGLSPEETTFARRGFHGEAGEMRRRLEQIGATFVEGYHAALDEGVGRALTAKLDAIALERRGFAYEGAARIRLRAARGT